MGGLKPWTLLRLLVASLLLLLVPVFQVVAAASNEGLDPSSAQPCHLRDALMDPTYEERYGVNFVWQIPPNAKAILFFAHGGHEDALRYFDPGPKCQHCYGLPEDRTAVLEALRRGYAVIVVKSLSVGWDTEEDLRIVTKIIKEWTNEHSLEGLPLAAWGFSAGTYLASALPFSLPMRAVVLMCGDGVVVFEEMATPDLFPPTLFAYMPVDFDIPSLNLTGKRLKAMAILAERGVKVYDTPCRPKPISPLFFTERILCMSDEMSHRVFAAYQDAGWVDSNGYLTKSTWVDDWESVLWEARALPFCTALGDLCLAAHVGEELQMAFAEHSFTSAANDVIFPWLDSTILSSYSGEDPVFEQASLGAATF